MIITALDLEDKVFVVYKAFISQNSDIHPLWKAQIAILKADEAPTSVFPKYTDFTDIFCKDVAAELSKETGINYDVIDLIKGQ